MIDSVGEHNTIIITNGFYFYPIVQFIMRHFVLNKRKVLLDQLQEGLKTLNVLDKMKARPLLFERFFVHQEGSVTPQRVNEVLTFPDGDDHKDMKDMVIRFIDQGQCDGMPIHFIPLFLLQEMYMNAPMYDCN